MSQRINASGPKPFNYNTMIGGQAGKTGAAAGGGAKFTAALGATTQKAAVGGASGVPGSSVLGSVLGTTGANDLGSTAMGQAGGAVMGADMVQMNMKMNMQFMQLQNSMQMESRQFQAVSNALKVRHDSAMSAVRNMK
jgi:hypothetical protein